MGMIKTEGFNKEVVEMSELLKAIGHPARLSIVMMLVKMDTCMCSNIVENLPLSQPTISRHLSELKKVGLIKGTISGTNVCYCLDETVWKSVAGFIAQMNIGLENKNNCC